MNLLKKQNWWLYLILTVLTGGLFSLYIARKLNLYDEDAWYNDYKNWMIGVFLFILPIIVMFVIFIIQMNCKVAQTLNVPGSEIYSLPYSWILCVVVPVIGWTLLLVMYIYIIIWSSVMISKGNIENMIQKIDK